MEQVLTELQEIVTLKEDVSKVTVLCLFSKNHDSTEPLKIISQKLGELKDRFKIEIECSPLGKVDHFRLIKSEVLFKSM